MPSKLTIDALRTYLSSEPKSQEPRWVNWLRLTLIGALLGSSFGCKPGKTSTSTIPARETPGLTPTPIPTEQPTLITTPISKNIDQTCGINPIDVLAKEGVDNHLSVPILTPNGRDGVFGELAPSSPMLMKMESTAVSMAKKLNEKGMSVVFPEALSEAYVQLKAENPDANIRTRPGTAPLKLSNSEVYIDFIASPDGKDWTLAAKHSGNLMMPMDASNGSFLSQPDSIIDGEMRYVEIGGQVAFVEGCNPVVFKEDSNKALLIFDSSSGTWQNTQIETTASSTPTFDLLGAAGLSIAPSEAGDSWTVTSFLSGSEVTVGRIVQDGKELQMLITTPDKRQLTWNLDNLKVNEVTKMVEYWETINGTPFKMSELNPATNEMHEILMRTSALKTEFFTKPSGERLYGLYPYPIDGYFDKYALMGTVVTEPHKDNNGHINFYLAIPFGSKENDLSILIPIDLWLDANNSYSLINASTQESPENFLTYSLVDGSAGVNRILSQGFLAKGKPIGLKLFVLPKNDAQNGYAVAKSLLNDDYFRSVNKLSSCGTADQCAPVLEQIIGTKSALGYTTNAVFEQVVAATNGTSTTLIDETNRLRSNFLFVEDTSQDLTNEKP